MLGRAGDTRVGDRTVSATAPLPMIAGGKGAAAKSNEAHEIATPWALAALVFLYLVWAVLEQHQRVRNQLRPQNIALNVRNLIAIVLPVIIGISLLKILATKLVGWGVPGANLLLRLVGGV